MIYLASRFKNLAEIYLLSALSTNPYPKYLEVLYQENHVMYFLSSKE